VKRWSRSVRIMLSPRLTPARLLALALALLTAPGCLVVSLNPGYDNDSIVWEPDLLGTWHDADDNVTVTIQRGEWRSYRVHYEHPIETGELTGYLTAVGDARYLDLMPARGHDHGSFLVPVHAVVRVRLQTDTLEVVPLSYDWFFARLRSARAVSDLAATFDQKENALITAPTPRLRRWLRAQPPEGPTFGAGATFTRKSPD
jgi:hypothetical protein